MMKISISRRSLTDLVVFTAGFFLCLALAWQMHFRDGKPIPGRGVFASDKSIYYVYLPATFIYGWDVTRFPHRCDTTYRGFVLDYKTGKLLLKMTCGVAILWTPFFVATHAAAVLFDLQPDGFSLFYQKMAIIPPVIFLMLGLYFLKRFLGYYFPPFIVWGSLLFLFAGTNLYYYGLMEGLMSHVHSFFLFSLYLFLLKKFLGSDKSSRSLLTGIFLVASLAILVRPSNLIILAWLLLLDARSWAEVKDRIKSFFRPLNVLTFLIILFIVFLPQFVYWKYASGSFLHYSYGPERFLNWKSPVILPVLFSPLNGLFLYNPMVLLFVAGSVWMIVRRSMNGLLLLLTLALVTYISGSWHMWYFGGSYGARQFVEYYALLSLGSGFFLSEAVRLKNVFIKSLIVLLLTVFSYYNLRMIYYNYWNTSSVWAWDDFRTRLDHAGVLYFSRDNYSYIQDFENITFEPALVQENYMAHTGKLSALLDSRYLYCGIYYANIAQILDQQVCRVSGSLWVSPVTADSTDAELVVSVEDSRHFPWLRKTFPVNRCRTKAGEWSEVKFGSPVPGWLNDQVYRLNVYLHNPGRKTMFVDDIRVKVE